MLVGRPVGLDIIARREWIDVHASDAHALGARPLRLLKLYRDIGFHAHHVRGLHRAAKMDDGRRMRTAELRELRQDPGSTETFSHRAADDAAKIEILIEVPAQ